MWKLKDTLFNNQWVKEEITQKIRKIPWDKLKCKQNIPKFMGYKKSKTKMKINTSSHLDRKRKISKQ